MSDLWANVRVDPVATDALIEQLVATSGALGEVAAILDADGPVIADDWGGPHRDAFDDERTRLVTSARAAAEELVRVASAAAALLSAAEGEQHLRMRLRSQALAETACQPGEPC
jgi:hypothetical protein